MQLSMQLTFGIHTARPVVVSRNKALVGSTGEAVKTFDNF